MPTLGELRERKKEVSGQVSAQTRTSALGLLAVSWGLLTAHDEPLKTMAARVSHAALWGMAVVAFLVLACDLLQYVASTAVANEALHRAEESADQKALYDTSSFAYKVADLLYFTKFGFLLVGAFLLIWVFVELAA